MLQGFPRRNPLIFRPTIVWGFSYERTPLDDFGDD